MSVWWCMFEQRKGTGRFSNGGIISSMCDNYQITSSPSIHHSSSPNMPHYSLSPPINLSLTLTHTHTSLPAPEQDTSHCNGLMMIPPFCGTSSKMAAGGTLFWEWQCPTAINCMMELGHYLIGSKPKPYIAMNTSIPTSTFCERGRT